MARRRPNPTDHPIFMARSIKRTRKELRKFEPLLKGDHLLTLVCPCCGDRFAIGDTVTPVPIGPGRLEDSRARAREGRPYNAIAVPAHWSCATGEDNNDQSDSDDQGKEDAPPAGS